MFPNNHSLPYGHSHLHNRQSSRLHKNRHSLHDSLYYNYLYMKKNHMW
ncbi:MAG: hypothetical protein J6X62_01590 [Bacteroidales bacterium]|nr:hypothetical protein [Bacteroidales bacterium]